MAVGWWQETYLNPVYGRSFADPFVLKHCGVYYAYSTGHARDGLVFEVITSTDLVNWEPLGGAMQPLATGDPFYWAPEVTYHDGRFYLYYSVGNETLMTLRVAVSDRPAGGFIDSGVKLTAQDFAIDAHVFRDDDGTRWMFYATDFLDYPQIGTGTVVDRMIDMFTLAGNPRPVTRARYDWQVYDPARKEKGGVRWHTIEGPFVLKRKGMYYEMFSGGNWQNISYGASFAVSDTLENDNEWTQFSDGEKTLPLIRTIPDKVIGPGHNSVIRGPNNRELYCVYHRWVDDERVLAIDRMDFAGGDRMFISGPTYAPQPAPYQPAALDAEVTEIELEVPSSFLLEISFRGVPEIEFASAGRVPFPLRLPAMSADIIHELRLEIDGHLADVRVDGARLGISSLPGAAGSIRLRGGAKYFGLAVTHGYELLFEDDRLDERGWKSSGEITFDGKHLVIGNGRIERAVPTHGDCEIAVNIAFAPDAKICIAFASPIRLSAGALKIGDNDIRLPARFASDVFHQFRFVRKAGNMTAFLDDTRLGDSAVTAVSDGLRIMVIGSASFDMIRYTAI